MKLEITEIEIVDETGEVQARVKAFDSTAAEVELLEAKIHTVKSWAELSERILEALARLELCADDQG